MFNRYVVLAATLLLLLAVQETKAAEFRILYAEPFTASWPRSLASAQGKPSGSLVTFEAHGRRFDLELQSNERLLGKLGTQDFAGIEVTRGRIVGVSGSWARLTYANGQIRGVVWDGRDLFAIEPHQEAAPHLVDASSVGESQHVIYRLSDAQLPLSRNFCGADGRGPEGSGRSPTGLDQYKSLVYELQAQAGAVAPTKQLELAAIGDFEMFEDRGPQAIGFLLSELNIIDGIFSEQVGVVIVASEVRIFDTAADPFSSNDAVTLLDQVSAYRLADSAIRARGLAHLATGRDLNGDTAGIAYIGALCDAQYGVSLGETWIGLMPAALVAAHELGHNFGAPHDNQAGSPCESTGSGFLMSPFFNDSDTFSQCSLDQIRPRVEAASCLLPAQLADVALQLPSSPTEAFNGQPLAFPIEVRAIGNADSTNVVFTMNSPADLTVLSATAASGVCTTGAGIIQCELGTVSAGTTRRIDLSLRVDRSGTYPTTARVTSSNDRESDNNFGAVNIVSAAAADAYVTIPAPITGFTDQPLDFTVTVRARGAVPVQAVQLDVTLSGMELQFLASSVGSCAQSGTSRVLCSLGDIAPGQTRTVDVRAMPTQQRRAQGFARVSASNDGDSFDDVLPFSVEPLASIDAGISVTPQRVTTAVDASTEFTAVVRGIGPQPAANTVASLSMFGDTVIEAASVASVPCTQSSGRFDCALGTVNSGAERRIDVRVRPMSTGNRNVRLDVTTTGDDYADNNTTQFEMIVREAVDVTVSSIHGTSVVETGTRIVSAQATSRGASAASNVATTFTVPAGLTIIAAESGPAVQQSCSVTANVARCTAISLAPGATVTTLVTVRGETIGEYLTQFGVTADGDAQPGNNSSTSSISVLPLIDVSLDPLPSEAFALEGSSWSVPLNVRTGLRAANDVTLVLGFSSQLSVESASTPVGTCTVSRQAGRQISCSLGALPGNTTVSVVGQVRATAEGNYGISARVTTPNDVDYVNDTRSGSVTVDGRGDVGVSFPSSPFTGLVGSSIPVTVRLNQLSPASVRSAILDLTLPTGIALAGTPAGLVCSTTAGGISCQLGDLVGGGNTSTELTMNVSAGSAGTFQGTARFRARNDVNSTNDEANFSITANAPAPPPTPPSSGNGGGGGALDFLALWSLLASLSVAITRRSRHPTIAVTALPKAA